MRGKGKGGKSPDKITALTAGTENGPDRRKGGKKKKAKNFHKEIRGGEERGGRTPPVRKSRGQGRGKGGGRLRRSLGDASGDETVFSPPKGKKVGGKKKKRAPLVAAGKKRGGGRPQHALEAIV